MVVMMGYKECDNELILAHPGKTWNSTQAPVNRWGSHVPPYGAE